MKPETILKKAIEKAVKNGYKNGFLDSEGKEEREQLCKLWIEDDGYFYHIFSHDFAKAFWGDELKGVDTYNAWRKPELLLKGWEYHLQQMVLEEEPLKYLEKFI